MGWLDLRGDLHLEAPGVFIDARVSSIEPAVEVVKEPLAGAVGLELACLLLMDPVRVFGVRQAATELWASSKLGLLKNGDACGSPGWSTPNIDRSADLFRALARRWSPESVDLASLPRPGDTPINDSLHLGLDDPEHQTGLGVGGHAGRHRLRRSSERFRWVSARSLCPRPGDPAAREATTGRLLIAAGTTGTLRVAPVPMVTSRRVVWTAQETAGWPLDASLFVALDLAQDPRPGQ